MGSSIRITGMASGLDTDSIVEQLMNVEKQPYYKAQRQQYLTEYKIEAYREVTTKLTDFNNKYLDTLSSTNMKSGSFFRKFTPTITSSLTGAKSNAVTITATNEGNPGTHTVSIKQVAQKAQISGAKTAGIIKTGSLNPSLLTEEKTIEVTIDGKSRNITIGQEGGYESLDALSTALENAINNEFGFGYDQETGKVKVSVVDGTLQMKTVNGASQMSLNDSENVLALTNANTAVSTGSTIDQLKNAFSKELTYSSVGEGDDVLDQITFKINGKDFTFDKDSTLKEIMQEINNDEDIKVTMSFNQTTGTFTIESDATGQDENISIEDTGTSNFFSAIGFIKDGETKASTNDPANIADGATSQVGLDTLAMVDGISIARSQRTFTLDGITYQANEVTAPGENVNITLDIDTEAVYTSIKEFVDDYNELVDFIQGKLDEKYDKDYQPLTDDERSEMSDDEIEKWDKKAKTGLLHNDSSLQQLLNQLRSTFSGQVKGISTTFSDIGIKTGTYTNGGKIILDDDGVNKLKKAIANNLDDVVALFTQKSTNYSAASSRSYTFDQKATRKQEEGLMNRFYDTLEDYISTYRDTNNSKGILLEKAGKVGDTSETTSILSKSLIEYTRKVTELLDKVNSKYDKYYKKFSALETAMNSLNSQSSYISQLLGQTGM